MDRGIVVTIGIGWSRQKLPTKSSDNPINPNTAFQTAFNRQNQFMPNDRDNLEPASAWCGTLTTNRNGLFGPGIAQLRTT